MYNPTQNLIFFHVLYSESKSDKYNPATSARALIQYNTIQYKRRKQRPQQKRQTKRPRAETGSDTKVQGQFCPKKKKRQTKGNRNKPPHIVLAPDASKLQSTLSSLTPTISDFTHRQVQHLAGAFLMRVLTIM